MYLHPCRYLLYRCTKRPPERGVINGPEMILVRCIDAETLDRVQLDGLDLFPQQFVLDSLEVAPVPGGLVVKLFDGEADGARRARFLRRLRTIIW